eukprot:6487594-Amphidinium_carterae.9
MFMSAGCRYLSLLLLAMHDRYKRACQGFGVNEELGYISPTATETHSLSVAESHTGGIDPMWTPYFSGIRSTCSELSHVPLLVCSDSSLNCQDRSVTNGTLMSYCNAHATFALYSIVEPGGTASTLPAGIHENECKYILGILGSPLFGI